MWHAADSIEKYSINQLRDLLLISSYQHFLSYDKHKSQKNYLQNCKQFLLALSSRKLSTYSLSFNIVIIFVI